MFVIYNICVCDLPLHHEWVFLLHGEVRVDLNGIILILQLQQLLPALLCYQLAVVDDICTEKRNDNHMKHVSNRPEEHVEIQNLN